MMRFGFGRARAELQAARTQAAQSRALLEALDRAQAVIEFDLDGTVRAANANFCSVMGYAAEEIIGRHHRLFMDPAEAAAPAYAEFWKALREGRQQVGEFRRFAKGGREVWLQASYSPVLGEDGKPCRVVKYASDVSARKWQASEAHDRLAAVSDMLAVIDFTPDGVIQNANANFCQAVGYTLEEIRGRHHRMFVDTAYAASAEYREFWLSLARGQTAAGQFERVAKGGRKLWLQANYYPIRDLSGKVVKVVKYAIDISGQVALAHAIQEIRQVVAASQTGDLSRRIGAVSQEGNVAELCAGVDALIDSIGAIVSMVRAASASITTASGEISSGNSDLSRRTEQAAASIQATAASIEEVAATMRQNAENALRACAAMESTGRVANQGSEAMGAVVRTMEQIRQSSGRVVDIIGVIDGIAFQTNILALNAAVEAARAGEQGRGFAVVAGEVRNLAQRSAAAAREVKTLISASLSDVDAGARLVQEAGGTMNEILNGIREVDQRVAEISQASREQSTGIDQISEAVTRFEDVTQQNAALVEQAAAAAASLLDQAQSMEESMAAFRLSA